MLFSKELLFDTKFDTKNIFVTIRTSLLLHNYTNADGTCQILLRISCNGTERLPLGLYVKPSCWNKKEQMVIEHNQELQDLNLLLKRELNKINDLQIFYRLSEIVPSVERIVRDYKNNIGFRDFNSFFKETLKQRAATISKSTYAKEDTIYNKLKNFRDKISFSEIDEKFFFDLRNHLAKKGNQKTTINGNIKVVKKYLRFASKFGVKLRIDLDDIVSGSTKGQKNYLNAKEVKSLYEYYNSSFITLNKKICLGYFLTSCFTGMRISDILNQQRQHLLKGYFQFIHVKTKKYQNMELNNTSLDIIRSCDELFVKFYSPKHIRETIQDICKFVGITKHVDYHTSRHTFGTNCILLGVSIAKLQILMNHSDPKETQSYMHLAELERNAKADALDNLL